MNTFLSVILFVITFVVVGAFSPVDCFSSGRPPPVQHTSSKYNDRLRLGAVLLSEINHQSENETLMKIYFSLSGEDVGDELIATNLLLSYVASFPFSAVLPVQPLTYVPRKDGRGVDVSFLRKKTTEKSSIDGGIEFLIMANEDSGNPGDIILEAVRNSEGQSISKVFTEGLVVKSFINGLYGEKEGKSGLNREELLSRLHIDKVVHKWM
mmetsp:Transcript_1556/g.2352  ORF Transcript_1556/g.2352 Transcript_1556/m.2352 type:complete len:210 (-) Transcript_1556:90-719(-)